MLIVKQWHWILVVAAACMLPLSWAAAAPKEPKASVSASGVAMVLLPGGVFSMGDENGEVDEVPHEVTVSPFYIDQCEVSQAEYVQVMGDNTSKFKGKGNPVEQIRWSDAVRYCNERSRLEGLEPAYDLKKWTCRFEANGYRLPTEAEWEYAARAGTASAFSFGASDAKLKQHGWSKDNSGGKPRPVKQRRPNPWGLYDMHGNVWEWCLDWYQATPEGGSDPDGPDSGSNRVCRGGAWNRTNASECRSAFRYKYAYPTAAFSHFGFRLVRTLP